MHVLGESGKPLDLDCGIPFSRISTWLDDELGTRCNDHTWTFADENGTCTVEIHALENREFKHVSLERTRLMAWGDEQTLETFYKLFTLRFISAGG